MTTHRDLQESERQLRETTHNELQVAVSTNIPTVTSLARQLYHNFDRKVLHQLQVTSNITRYDIIVTVSVLVHALLTDEQFHNDEPATYRNYDGPADEAFAVIMNLLMYESLKDDWEGLHQDILTLLPDATREEREMRDNTIMSMIAWLGEKAGLGILRERMKDVEHLKRYRELPDLLQRLVIAGSVHRDAQHLEIFRVLPSGDNVSYIFGDTLLMMAVAFQSEEFVEYIVKSDVYVDELDQNNNTALDRLTSQPEVDWDKALRILRILSKSLLLRYLNNYDEDDEDEDEDDDMSDWEEWKKDLRRMVSKWEEGVRQHRRSWKMTTHRDLQESKRQLQETTHNKLQVAVSTNIPTVTSLARQLHHNFDRNVLHQLQVISNITRYDIIVTVSVLVHALLTDEQFYNDEPATYRNYAGPADEAFAVIMNLLMYESLKDDWEGLHQDILTLLPDATREEREMRDNTIMSMIAWLGEKAGLGILRERMKDVEYLKRYRDLPDLLARLAIAGSVHRDAQHSEIFGVIPSDDDVSYIFGDTLLMMAVAFQSEEFVEYLVDSDVYVDELDENNENAFDRLTSQPEVDWDKALRILRILSKSFLGRSLSNFHYDEDDEDDDMSDWDEWEKDLRRMVSKWEEGVRQHRRSWQDID